MPGLISWSERRAWALGHTKAFPKAADLVTTVVSIGLTVAYLSRYRDQATLVDYLVSGGIATIVALTVTPASLFLWNLVRAPSMILAGRLVAAERGRTLAERERNLLIEARESKLRPGPVIWFSGDGSRTMLNVRNMGAAAFFHANAIVLRTNTRSTAAMGHAQRLRWEKVASTEAKIVTGGEDGCCVATVDIVTHPIAEVRLNAMCDAGPGVRWPFQAYWSADWFPEATGIIPAEPHALIEVTITAEPEMRDGPVRKRFQLGPGAFHEEGSRGYLFDADGRLPDDPPGG